jgi:hypothetical protein
MNGQEVVYPAQWSIKEKKWQPYGGKSDWWYPTHKDWKTRSNFKLCAGCHSTGSDHYKQKWVELNIACESCHGPGKTHAETPKLGNIVNPSRLSVERSMDVCLSCHQAGKPPGDEYAIKLVHANDVGHGGTRLPDLSFLGTSAGLVASAFQNGLNSGPTAGTP